MWLWHERFVHAAALRRMTEPIRTLFITLKRSFAGTRDTHRRILESLGLRYRQQTVERANMGSIRGALDKASEKPVCGALINKASVHTGRVQWYGLQGSVTEPVCNTGFLYKLSSARALEPAFYIPPSAEGKRD